MRIKLKFSPSVTPIRDIQSCVNGFIHKCLGANNKFHDSFSPYSISSMQGGEMSKDGELTFPNGGYLYVSIPELVENDFVSTLVQALIYSKDVELHDLKFVNFEMEDFSVNKEFDLVRTISPILIKDKENKMVTFKEPKFMELLNEKTFQKLLKVGIDEKDLKTLSIEPFHIEKAKVKSIRVGDVYNISSQMMFVVKGKPNVRKTLYEMGIGKSTGSGFGAVSLNKFQREDY